MSSSTRRCSATERPQERSLPGWQGLGRKVPGSTDGTCVVLDRHPRFSQESMCLRGRKSMTVLLGMGDDTMQIGHLVEAQRSSRLLALFVLTVGCSGSQEDDEQSTDLTGGTSSTGGNTSAIGGTKGSNTGGTSSAGGQSPAGGSSSGGQGGNDPCGGCDEGFHCSLCFSPGLGGEGPDLFRSCLPDGVEC